MSTPQLVPQYAFLIQGTGEDENRLQAFDIALREAGPLVHNLVTVSSILPAGCKIISREEGIAMLEPGQITFCVMARQDTNTMGKSAAAAVGLVRLKDQKHYGFISEHHCVGQSKTEAGEYAEKLALDMFALKLKKKQEEMSPIEQFNASESIQVSTPNTWVCAVALCVFVI